MLRFTGEPDLVEHFTVQSRHGRFVRIRDAFPTRRLQSIDEGGLIRDAECFCVRPQILTHVPELDIRVQATPEMDEVVAVFHSA